MDRLGPQRQALDSELAHREMDFPQAGGIRRRAAARRRLGVEKLAVAEEGEDPAVELFPRGDRFAPHRVGTGGKVEFPGAAGRQVAFARGFEDGAQQRRAVAVLGHHEGVAELAGHRVRPHAEPLGMHRGEVLEQRFVGARCLELHLVLQVRAVDTDAEALTPAALSPFSKSVP